MFESFFEVFSNNNIILVLKILYYIFFIFIPFVLAVFVWDLWIDYRQALFFAKQEYLLLEVKLPKDIFKSPRAMEFFLNGLHQPFGDGNWYLKWWQGSTRPWFSLEVVSIDGAVHFYIWTRKSYKNAIESNLYSQYPGIEIFTVTDYVNQVSFDPETTGLFACEFGLTKPDVYPIKTYVDYGMDKDQKEEYKIDPLTPLIEFFGSVGRGNQIWLQIIVRSHANEDAQNNPNKDDLRWSKAASEEIKKIFEKTKPEKKEAEDKDKKENGRLPTKGEVEIVAALERSISKKGYDVGMRAIYIAPKDIFSSGNIGAIIGGITHFNSNDLNGFKPSLAGSAYAAPRYEFFPWKLWKNKNINIEKSGMFDAYKRRAYFHRPYKAVKYFILNTEELATVYHFMGSVSATPTFTRTESRKAEAPVNLPV